MTLPATNQRDAKVLEKVVIEGDLAELSAMERVTYYRSVCESLGLNPLTRPFEYLKLNGSGGKLTLYAKKDAAEQLTRIHTISLELRSAETIGDVRIVTFRAIDAQGRFVDATGVVTIGHLKGDNLANALMKAETKARRRATLALVGLGWLDETETETIRGAEVVAVDHATGEIAAPQSAPVVGASRKAKAPPSPATAPSDPQAGPESVPDRLTQVAFKTYCDNQGWDIAAVTGFLGGVAPSVWVTMQGDRTYRDAALECQTQAEFMAANPPGEETTDEPEEESGDGSDE